MAKKIVRDGSRGHGKKPTQGSHPGSLLAAAERKLLAASEERSLAAASADEAQRLLVRIREMRDKWRDLLKQQNRAGKRAPRSQAEANRRSREKADLFQDAVTRVEAAIARLRTAAETQPRVHRPATAAKRKATQRTARAAMRAEMSRKMAVLNETAASRRTATGGEQRVAASAVTRPAKTKKIPKPSGTPVVVPAADLPRTARRDAQPQTSRVDRVKQRAVRTRAKSARMQLKGVSTRRAGHVLAAGQRVQARRDRRGR